MGLVGYINSLSSLGKSSDGVSKFITTILRVQWPIFLSIKSYLCTPELGSLFLAPKTTKEIKKTAGNLLAAATQAAGETKARSRQTRDWLVTASKSTARSALYRHFHSTFDVRLCISNWPATCSTKIMQFAMLLHSLLKQNDIKTATLPLVSKNDACQNYLQLPFLRIHKEPFNKMTTLPK